MRYMQNKFKNFSLPIISIIALSACGGGSGGSDAAIPTVPVTPAPAQPLVVEYSENASIAALSSIDSLLQIAYVATSTIFKTQNLRSGAELSCSNGGIFTHELTDNDANQRLSEGDTITTAYRECFLNALQATADGNITYTISSFDAEQGYKAVVNTSGLNIDNSINLAGNVEIDYSVDAFGTTLSLSSQNNLEVSADGQVLITLSDLSIGKTESYTQAKYSITANGDLKDETFGGTYSFKQNTPFSGYFNEFPNEGELEIFTTSTDNFTLAANFVEDSFLYDITIDALVFSMQWIDAIEGALMAFDGQVSQTQDIAAYRSDNFSFISQLNAIQAENFGLGDSLYLMFSRPVANAEADFRDLAFESDSYPYTSIPATLNINGALVSLTPSSNLEAGKTYRVPNLIVTSENQQTTSVFTSGITTSTDIIPVVTAQSSVYRSGDTPWLDASDTINNTDGVLTYAWSEVTSNGISFSSPNEARTEFSVSEGLEQEIEVSVTISNTQGYTVSKNTRISFLANQGTFLSYDSPVGDYIGQAQQKLYTTDDGNFSLFGSAERPDYISVSFNGEDNWGLDLAAPNGEALAVGVYTGATRYPFQSPTAPGLNFSGSGRGCNQSSGSFEILELARGGSGVVESIAVRFEQSCEQTNPALTGEMRVNSLILLNP